MISLLDKEIIKQAVLGTLIKYQIKSLPVDIMLIAESINNCRLIGYSKHMKKFKLSYSNMIAFAETEDACTVYDAKKDKYIIFYNDVDYSIIASNRYRWNVAHELGHVLLKHHITNEKTKMYRNKLSRTEYKSLEDEANWFAAFILTPHIPLYFNNINTQIDLKECCQISNDAAKWRYKDYIKWKKNNSIDNLDSYDIKITKIFYDYMFKSSCSKCDHVFYAKFANFCPICGDNNIRKESKVENMKYTDGYLLNKNHKALVCPKCNNDQFIEAGEFCHICGTHIVNKCSNDKNYYWDCNDKIYINDECYELAPGNARYCIKCGSKTTFFDNGLLCDYRDYHESPFYEDIFEPLEESEIPF
jgi:Zn-dependent peptidase ImmA (M78 family)